jgi:hypothetical protein
VIEAVPPSPVAVSSTAPPSVVIRIVQWTDSERPRSTVSASCASSPFGEKVPSWSSTSHSSGAALSRGTSDEPRIQPSLSPASTR